MSNPNFNDRHIVKVMLQIAKNKRSLSKVEAKYDLEIQTISENRTREITSYLIKEGCVSQHLVLPERTHPSIILMPYASSEGEGLSEKGEDLLEDLINALNKEKSMRRRELVSGLSKNTIGWIMGIVSGVVIGVVVGFILWRCGWI